MRRNCARVQAATVEKNRQCMSPSCLPQVSGPPCVIRSLQLDRPKPSDNAAQIGREFLNLRPARHILLITGEPEMHNLMHNDVNELQWLFHQFGIVAD